MRKFTLTFCLCAAAILLGGASLFAQPANNDCSSASPIPISGGGWAYGSYVSDTVSLGGATLQPGEYVHPAQVAQDKSVWYSFSIPTTRNVRIILRQPGPPYAMNAGDAGWTLFRNGACLPGANEVVDPPILNIEGYTHECLKAGDYLLQVTGALLSNGPIYVELQVSGSTANETDYDYASGPYDFGLVSGITLTPASLNHFYDLGCQSIFETENRCPDSTYTQSTWHTFTTDNQVDYLRFELAESPWNTNLAGPRNFGYVLYEGNCILDSIPDNGPGLTTVDACRTITATGQNTWATTWYPCDLQPNTTYSIQLFAPTTYTGRVNVRMYEVGSQPTQSPDPQNIPPAFSHGTLAYNTNYNVTDYFACNSLLSNNLCGTVVPDTVWQGGTPYDMNIWLTFSLSQPANVDMDLFELDCQPNPLVRIFRGDVGSNCNLPLDTTFQGGLYYRCMPPGDYSVQILGRLNPPQGHTCFSNVGKGIQFRVRVDQVAPMQFGLFTPQDIDSVNSGAALLPGNQYLSTQDYFDCQTTVLPAGNHCDATNFTNDRAIYRLINIGQDGILTVGGGVWNRFQYRLYRGDASSLPVLGGEIQGLVDQAGCQSTYYPFKVCVTPGWYTLVTYSDISDVTYGDRPWLRFDAFPPTSFTDPNFPEVLDTLGMANGTVAATPTRFNCDDNPLTILGYAPCNNATKQVYREFFLDSPQLVTFTSNYSAYQYGGGVTHRIFSGRIGNSSLTGLHRDCGGNWTECMPAGWYTVVSYGYGQTFGNPAYTSGLGGSIGDLTAFTLTINPSVQQFGTFATAEQVNGGNPVFWQADYANGHTQQIPRNYRTYTLGTEYWVCADNLPFPAGIAPCTPSHNRLSYRVFNLSKPSHLFIDGLNPYPYTHQSRIYQGDITGQPPPFAIVQDCITDDIRLCLQPGTYTLVTFASDADIGRTMTPVLYLDSLGVSKFDHAANAYDFGNVPNSSTEYRGNIADPPGPFGRAASNDFIFCTTTAEVTDPVNVCPIGTAPPGPALPNPWNPRQNLWYTFEVTGPGLVEVAVYNQTTGKPTRSPFAVYKSSTGLFPPADSTLAQGLEFVVRSTTIYCGNLQKVNFFRDPCNGISTERYYVLVDRHVSGNYASNQPNTQLEVGVTFSPAPAAFVQYDHYSQANLITDNPTTVCNGPYTPDTLYGGTFTGCLGNLNCATRDASDQNSCGQHTIWYAFDVGGSGAIRINYDRPGAVTAYNANDIQLYRSVVPGDSTTGGLVRIPLSTVNLVNPDVDSTAVLPWGEGCMEPGRYYIMFTGCNYPTETVIPRIWLLPQAGDLCSDPVVLEIDSAGNYGQTITVNCLTIGEAPGEDGSNMGCLSGPTGYKSAWFQVNLNDTSSKYDIDLQINEYTTVTGDNIQYRIGYGDCSAMTFDNCVSDGVFIILNLKCRESGSFWVQVTMPDFAMDSLRLNITATPVSDTACQPIDPLRPRANFDYSAACSDVPVVFTNNSTTGPGVSYVWDFGDGYGSTVMNPIHQYAVPDTYLVSLVVDNGIYLDTLYRQVIVYQRPGASFSYSPVYPVFVGDPVSFSNSSINTLPSSTYYWNFCAGPPPCGASSPNYVGPNPPPVSWSTAGWKTVCLTVLSGNCDSTFCMDIFVSDTTIFAGGPFDGHSIATLTDTCEQTEQNVFAGGPYDGEGNVFLTDTCTSFVPNVFAGGPFDGADFAFYTDSCVMVLPNVYAGGPYDGASVLALQNGCPVFQEDVFAGGPFDGHGVIAITDSCSSLEINVFAGGPYDGHDRVVMYCDTIPISPPDTSSCDSCFYAGGPYDGAAVAALTYSCPAEIPVFSGGPYDGHGSARLDAYCPQLVSDIFSGGPYDGHASDFLSGNCTGFAVNFFAGGPYDGHGQDFLSGNCSRFVINVFAGGPYDGHDPDRNVPVSSTPFTVSSDTICVGFSATFNASAATNWFGFDGNNYIWLNGITASYTTPVFYSPGIYTYWVDNPYNCDKVLVQALVLDTLAGPDFVFSPGCLGDTSYFTNQSIVPGPSQSSFGNVGSGTPINALGTTGVPPPPGLLSFSSAQYLNFGNLYNNVNDQQLGWTANNTGASTQWAQWRYLTPKSVNRFYYWPRNNCCASNQPIQLRLYYDDGGGWVLAKVWVPPYPSNAIFDTGLFFETANIYAQRWKLEADVTVPNAPTWGEFQVFASDPMVGGNTYWDFGDGFTSTLQDPTHIYGGPGTYNVTLMVDVPTVLCVNNVVRPITIDDCNILPLTRNQLSGHHLPDQEVIALDWAIEGNFNDGELLKWTSSGWKVIHIWEQSGESRYYFNDEAVLYGSINLYQVRATDDEGRLQYSNQVSVFVERPSDFELILYPNPVENGLAGLLLKLPEPSSINIEIYDLLGHRLMQLPEIQYARGIHRLKLNVMNLPAATYIVQVKVNERAFSKRMVVMGI